MSASIAATTAPTRSGGAYPLAWKTEYYGTTTVNPSCATALAGNGLADWGRPCGPLNAAKNNFSCYPWIQQNLEALLGTPFFTPATRCPTGWTSVGATTSASGTTAFVGFSPGETEYRCCPEGFTTRPSSENAGTSCIPTQTMGMVVTVTQCNGSTSGSPAPTTETQTWTNVGQLPFAQTPLFAEPLRIRFRAEDVNNIEPTATSTSAGGTVSTTGRPTSTGGSSSSSSSSSSGSGRVFNRSALIAIIACVGGTTLVAFLGLMWYWCWMRRRKPKRATTSYAGRNGGLQSGDTPPVVGMQRFQVGPIWPWKTKRTDEVTERPYDTASELTARPAESHYSDSHITASSRPAESEYNTSNPFTDPKSPTNSSTVRASKILARPTESVFSRSTFPETEMSAPSRGVVFQPSATPTLGSDVPKTVPGAEDTLAVLRARRAKIAEERDDIERLQRLREEEEELEEEIARLERRREGG